MKTTMSRALVWCLAACLLLLSGVAYPQLAAHASKHAHHNAATHASALCSWLCAAGQTAECAGLPSLPDAAATSTVAPAASDPLHEHLVLSNASRGPPSFSV